MAGISMVLVVAFSILFAGSLCKADRWRFDSFMEDSSCFGSSSGKTTGNKGLSLIKSFEGLRLRAYQDSVGVWTIGYGHTRGVRKGQVITEKQAEAFLRQDLRSSERYVSHYVEAKLSHNQFDALVSWTFNLGSGSLRTSTMLKKLNKCQYEAVPCEMMRWVKAGGKVLKGLVRRRKAEGELFNGGSFTC